METEFHIGQDAFNVCKVIIRKQPIIQVRLIAHDVGLNWSQEYKTCVGRKKNILNAFSYTYATRRSYVLNREEFLNSELKYLKNKIIDSNEVLSITSRVLTSEGIYLHIPMMNFHPENGFGVNEIIFCIQYLYPKTEGALLNSGRFYHYYGNYLLTQLEWEAFIGSFLIPFHLIHPGYAGYRLMDGFSTLRLTAEPNYKPQIPIVFRVL